VASTDGQRPFDVPWLVLDSRAVAAQWDWSPVTRRDEIFEEIAKHADANPFRLSLTDD
jgi:CDP-paratose 2-epimerase